MAKRHVIFEKHVDEKEPVVVVKNSQKELRIATVESYKKQNPWKYELKKAALDKWINEAK